MHDNIICIIPVTNLFEGEVPCAIWGIGQSSSEEVANACREVAAVGILVEAR